MARRSDRLKKMHDELSDSNLKRISSADKPKSASMTNISAKCGVSPGETEFITMSRNRSAESTPLSLAEKKIEIAKAKEKKTTEVKLVGIILPPQQKQMAVDTVLESRSTVGPDISADSGIEEEDTELDRTLSLPDELPDDWLRLDGVQETPPNTPIGSDRKRMPPPDTPTVIKKKKL